MRLTEDEIKLVEAYRAMKHAKAEWGSPGGRGQLGKKWKTQKAALDAYKEAARDLRDILHDEFQDIDGGEPSGQRDQWEGRDSYVIKL